MGLDIGTAYGLDHEAEDWLMGTLEAGVAAEREYLESATTRVIADVVSLRSRLAELRARADAGEARSDDMIALEELERGIDALDPSCPVTLASEPVGAGT